MQLTITRRNGDRHVVLYDEADHPVVASHHWCVLAQDHTFYARTTTRQALKLHRLLLPGFATVDHVNGNGLDNRRVNLRGATLAQNLRNKRAQKNSATGFKGVFSDGNGRWRARIMAEGKTYNLGSHDTPEQAAMAYDTAAIQMHGEFARLNFPQSGAVA